MANYLTYDLEVLANSSAEINQIAERLKQPSTELVNWVAEKYGESVNEIAEDLRELVAFEATSDAIATGDPEDGPQMRNFEVSFKNNGASGLVDSHLFEVSKAFPKPVLLLEYYDEMTSYSGKMVIRAGKIVQSMYDGYHRAQAQDWVLLDIFRPFRIEHENGLEFGSLWQEWLNDIGAAVQVLKCRTNGELVEAKRLSHELFARNAKFLNAQFSKFYEEEAKKETEIRAVDSTTALACLKELKEQCLYLHFDGVRYCFKKDPNVTLLIEQESGAVGRDERQVEERIKEMLEARITGRNAVVWRAKSGDIPDKEPSFLVAYMPFDFGTQARSGREVAAKEIFENYGSSPRKYRNGLGLAVPARRIRLRPYAAQSATSWRLNMSATNQSNSTSQMNRGHS